MVSTDYQGRAPKSTSPIRNPEDFDVLICHLYKSWLTCPTDPEGIEHGQAAAVGFGSRVAERARALFPHAAYVVLGAAPDTNEHWLHTVLDGAFEPVTPWVTDGDVPEDAEDRFEELLFFGACLAHLLLGKHRHPVELTLCLDGLAGLLDTTTAKEVR